MKAFYTEGCFELQRIPGQFLLLRPVCRF